MDFTDAELASLDDGSGDIYRWAGGTASCGCPIRDGVIRHQRTTCTDGIVAWFGWYADEDPEPPGTIEDIVAASVEHHGHYRNELRHLPPEPRDQQEADELAAMREILERRSNETS